MSENSLYVKDEVIPGKIWRRIVASLIDHAILIVLMIPTSNLLGSFFNLRDVPLHQGGELPREIYLLTVSMMISFTILIYVYFTFFHVLKGATPGKMAMGLRLVVVPDGGNIGPLRSFVREVIGKTVSGFLFIGFVVMLIRKDHRSLHDLIARTIVISSASR
ncbi:MAG: RDD family protein [Bdellovibrio sp.]|nr:RDD family protein [Bdellovibrio sp.]